MVAEQQTLRERIKEAALDRFKRDAQKYFTLEQIDDFPFKYVWRITIYKNTAKYSQFQQSLRYGVDRSTIRAAIKACRNSDNR
jgi:hypothetical protein